MFSSCESSISSDSDINGGSDNDFFPLCFLKKQEDNVHLWH